MVVEVGLVRFTVTFTVLETVHILLLTVTVYAVVCVGVTEGGFCKFDVKPAGTDDQLYVLGRLTPVTFTLSTAHQKFE